MAGGDHSWHLGHHAAFYLAAAEFHHALHAVSFREREKKRRHGVQLVLCLTCPFRMDVLGDFLRLFHNAERITRCQSTTGRVFTGAFAFLLDSFTGHQSPHAHTFNMEMEYCRDSLLSGKLCEQISCCMACLFCINLTLFFLHCRERERRRRRK